MSVKTISKSLPNGDYIEARVQIPGDGDDYFSVSGLYWEKRGTWSGKVRADHGRDIDAGGQITEEISAAFPELAPIMVTHLADAGGVPMHAETNGWYFYSGDARRYEEAHPSTAYGNPTNSTDHERGARALHISPDTLPHGMSREEFGAFVAELKANVWPRMAEAARAAFGAL